MIEIRVEDESGKPVLSKQFEKSEVSIGRAANNDLVIASSTVSSHHSRLFQENGGWMVEDTKSTNGTLLKGVAVTKPTPVRNGDSFEIGGFRVHLGPAGAESQPVDDATIIGAAD